MKRAYLAGPDVFRKDAWEHGLHLKALCRDAGIEGVFPLDSHLVREAAESPWEFAGRIRAANLAMLRSCQLVLANITPFRGPNADDGTAYEMGYAAALGLPVYPYTTDRRPLLDRTRGWDIFVYQAPGGEHRDSNGMLVEDLNLPVNLMLVTMATGVYLSFELALEAAAAT